MAPPSADAPSAAVAAPAAASAPARPAEPVGAADAQQGAAAAGASGGQLAAVSPPTATRDEQFRAQFREYRIYVERILWSLRPDWLHSARVMRGLSGRAALEEAIYIFVSQLRNFVTGCDDRKLSKAALRRARGIEAQLIAVSERLLVAPLERGVLAVNDLHGLWHGFTLVRGWRDSRVPQETLMQMLRGALAELEDDEVDQWRDQALTWELTLPEVHLAIPVSAWPALCNLLGRLPDCITLAELREALWQQSFVENPTHAPDHRNYRRFAALAGQMVCIGVELEPERVEFLVQQTLDLDRPWRERRDMLSGILSAASVEDRRAVVRHLDQRFEEHSDIDDFEIVCGIAEHIGIEIPRGGAIRRCALRRWALDPKRGGALPVARLIDFVDGDVAIGEDVATSLRQKGRVADAALLLSRLPKLQNEEPLAIGGLDVYTGDAELGRLCELLALGDDGANNTDRDGVFGPVEECAFHFPYSRAEHVCYNDTAAQALEAAKRLQGSPLLAVGVWREEVPFWHSPLTLLAFCTEERAELFDLVVLRTDGTGDWPQAANAMRALLSEPSCLKVVFGDDLLHVVASALGLGVASTLKHGDREPLGPFIDVRALVARVIGCATDDPSHVWPAIARRFLGMRMCPEEAGSNWSRRPLRDSQLHHAVGECWTQLPVLRALCAHGIVTPAFTRQHLVVQARVKASGGRGKSVRTHALGQLAPPGRLAWSEPGQGQAAAGATGVAAAGTATAVAAAAAAKAANAGAAAAAAEDDPSQPKPAEPTRIARLARAFAAGDGLPALPAGTLVEVFEDRSGHLASVSPLDGPGVARAVRWVPASALAATNSWECAAWVAALPRPPEGAHKEEPPALVQAKQPLQVARPRVSSGAGERPAVDREGLALGLLESLLDVKAAKRMLERMYDAQQH